MRGLLSRFWRNWGPMSWRPVRRPIHERHRRYQSAWQNQDRG